MPIREDVLTVLNEREPLKQQMAQELHVQLSQRNISAERFKPEKNLAQAIIERNPRVLVLDYLLGDVGTALDLLHELKAKKKESPIRTIVWTDEPSVSVAVNAMKLGAFDYIEIASANSLEKVLEAIELNLRESDGDEPTSEIARRVEVDETLISQDRSFQTALNLAHSLTVREQGIIVLLGDPGSGRNSVAKYIHQHRYQPGEFREIDWDLCTDDVRTICGGEDFDGIPLLSYGATVFIDHVESDSGELLETVARRSREIWRRDSDSPPLLVVGTSVRESALAWLRIAEGEVIELPPLRKRKEDLLPLLQRFWYKNQTGSRAQKFKFSSQLLEQVAELDWPGNVRQLRAAITEAAVLSQEIADGADLPEDEDPTIALPAKASKLSKTDRGVLWTIMSAKRRWERYHLNDTAPPSPVVARRAVDNALGNLRIAAAHLGTSVSQLREVLRFRGDAARAKHDLGAQGKS